MTLKTKRNIKKFAEEYFEKKKKEMGAINSTIINEILDTIIFDYDIPADEWSKVEDILWDVFEDVYEERDPFSNGIDESLEKKTCVLCGKEFTGYGNNAFPLADGICCDECNNKVIMARLNLHEEKEKSDNPEDKYDEQDIPLEEVKMEDKIYSIYIDKSYDSSTLESVANANDVEYKKTEDKIFLKGKKEDLLYVLDFADYELEDENDLVLEEEVEKKPIETAKTKLSKINKDEVETKPVQTIEFARYDPKRGCYIISKESWEDWD